MSRHVRLHGHVPQPGRQTLGSLSLASSGLPLHLMEALLLVVLLKEVMSLVQVFVLLMKALLKVTELFSLLSPLTQPQTTMPQTHPCGA